LFGHENSEFDPDIKIRLDAYLFEISWIKFSEALNSVCFI